MKYLGAISDPKDLVNKEYVDGHSGGGASIPVGTVQMYAGSTAPLNWLICDGSAVSRTTYASLFAIIGTTYGAGNGSTTFNLPNMCGRTPVGVGESTATGHTAHTLGQMDGSEKVHLTTDEIPAHTHGSKSLTGDVTWDRRFSGTSSASGILSKTNTSVTGYFQSTTGSSASNMTKLSVDASHTHDSVGGGQSHENMMPYLGINFIIYAGE